VEDNYVPPSPDRAVCPRCQTPQAAGRGVKVGPETTRLRLVCPCGQQWSEVRDTAAAATRFWSVPLSPPQGVLGRLWQGLRRRGPR
jgi:hypothetical protein